MKKQLISTSCIAEFSNAVKFELDASHMYKNLANNMQAVGYVGAQKFFLAESADELTHYQRHIDFLNDKGVLIDVPALTAQKSRITTLRDALEMAYEAELDLLEFYRKFSYDELKEYPDVFSHLLGFVDIQSKSVGEYADLLARLDLVGDDKCGMLIFDKELGKK